MHVQTFLAEAIVATSNIPKTPNIQPPSLPSLSSIPSLSYPLSNTKNEHEHSIDNVNDIIKNSTGMIYLSDTEINNEICKHQYSIFSINIRSLTKNILQLRQTVKKLSTTIIACQEIWHPHTGFVNIEGYSNIVAKTRKNKRGGGLGLYIKNGISYKILETVDQLKLKKIEAQGIKITENNKDTEIINIYRPPECDFKTTIDDLKEILKLVGTKTIIIGDLNIDVNKKNSMTKMYEDIIQKYNLIQKVNAYTRVTNKTASTIDHTVTNIRNLKTLVTHFMISDHLGIISCWGNKKTRKKSKIIKNPVENNLVHCKNTAEKIKKVDWEKWSKENQNKSANEMYRSLKETMDKCIEKSNNRRVRKGRSIQPYVNNKLLKLGENLEKARKKFLNSRSENNENVYKGVRKDYNFRLRKARNDYYANELQRESKNSKKIWYHINNLLNRGKNREEISEIEYNNEKLNDNKTIANLLCEYYRDSAYNRVILIDKKSNFLDHLKQSEKQTDTFELRKVTKKDTIKYIKTMKPKTSSGTDQIPSKVITIAANSLSTPITDLINKCFEEGTFPIELKNSKIKPIDKQKGKITPANLRPINLLSSIGKAIEKATIEQSNNHFKQFANMNQFGYKPAHCTYHPILMTRYLIEQELAKNRYVMLLMVDLSIAFETVNTGEILPQKLKHYGVAKKSVKFFNEYFQNRKHQVVWNNIISNTTELHNLSCVQGSSLGPNIYNVYTNEIKDVCESPLIGFADDTNVIVSANSIDELMNKGNKETERLDNYTSANDLIINKEKSSYMIITPKRKKKFDTNKTIKIGDTEILRVKHAKYLGLELDEKMNFLPQFNSLVKKLKVAINSLICTKDILNFKAKKMLYYALFDSHLQYGVVCYFDKLDKRQMGVLKKLQKKAVRLIFRAPINSHTNNLFHYSKIVPIEKGYHFESVKLIYKNKNVLYRDKQPEAIRKLIENDTDNRQTRNTDDYYKLKIKSGYKKGQVFYNIISEWNKADKELKDCGNINVLKKTIKNHKKELRKCVTNDCVICKKDCTRDYENYMNA